MGIKWKIFFSMFAVVILTFCLGATILIAATFRENLQREEEHGAEENLLLRTSMGAMFASESKDSWQKPEQVVREMMQEKLVCPKGVVTIRIWEEDKLLYQENRMMALGEEVLRKVPNAGEVLQWVEEKEEKWWLCTVSSLQVEDSVLHLESWRDIQAIYENRQKQYESYQGMIVVATIVTAVVSFAVASWFAEPIRRLSQVSRSVAAGDLTARAPIVRKDELGSLASDINQMADALQKDIISLQETNERQERLIGNLAHELKTPLTSIIGYADLLRLKQVQPEFVQEAAGYIFQEGKRLEKLSARLLEIVLLRKETLNQEKISVPVFMERIRLVLLPVLAEKEIQFHGEVEPGLFVYGEEILLETVMLNLADNARKACLHGGNIWMKAFRVEQGVSWVVEDDGKGANPEDLEHLTEAFYMEDKSRSRKEGGAGLGLAICAEILNLHQASLQLESSPGKGMKITMVFPEGGLL